MLCDDDDDDDDDDGATIRLAGEPGVAPPWTKGMKKVLEEDCLQCPKPSTGRWLKQDSIH